MVSRLWFLALAATSTFASPVEERQARLCTGLDYPCTQSGGVFILAARGTDGTAPFTDPFVRNANYDDLAGMNDVAQALINKAGKGSYCRALPYAASPNLAYVSSVLYGASLAQNITKDYVNRCGTNAKIILMGYSQGGQVMTSALTGTLTSGGNLDSIKQHITGGAFFASPSFYANYKIDGGNSTTNGLLSILELNYPYFNNTYSNRIRNYCQANDEFCAAGGFDAQSAAIHQAAVDTYKNQATNFLLPLV